ncbi:hypothetical protein Cgig2_010471 [Carnegiea gigantea]|uniref:Uncharacterized protein n=1 Tax=Carnegiea gigantea TaxID=171969 RepID=A0A9Q1JZF3_9CARY|nr:hypothetical protein Cgig2_010471 [Carnegiea gigantea]
MGGATEDNRTSGHIKLKHDVVAPSVGATLVTFRCLSFHGVVEGGLSFSLLHGFRHLLLYSTSSSSPQSLADQLVHSLCVSHQQAFSISNKLIQTGRLSGPNKVSGLNVLRKADSVMSFFKRNRLDQSHIRDMEHVRALKELLSNDDVVGIMKIMKGLRRVSFSDGANYLLPNVALLLNNGIPMEFIRKHLIARPSSFPLKTNSFEEILIRVEEKFGIPRGSSMFLYGVQLLASNYERTIQSKFQVFRSFGWTQSDIVEMMGKNPNCFLKSKEKIEKSLNFLMKELGYEPKYVITNDFLLTCSLEGRLVPRYRTLMVLNEKGLVRQNYAFTSAVRLTDSKFLKKCVLLFKEAHQFYATQIGTLSSSTKALMEKTHNHILLLNVEIVTLIRGEGIDQFICNEKANRHWQIEIANKEATNCKESLAEFQSEFLVQEGREGMQLHDTTDYASITKDNRWEANLNGDVSEEYAEMIQGFQNQLFQECSGENVLLFKLYELDYHVVKRRWDIAKLALEAVDMWSTLLKEQKKKLSRNLPTANA